jgi:hypothetical protein
VLSLQELSDRAEIQDLMVDYAYAVDQHRFDELDRIFTVDAVLDFTATGGERGDLVSIKAFFTRALGLFDGHQHFVGATKIAVDGDSATAVTMCHNPMWLTRDGVEHIITVGLWYHDTLVRTADGWRISSRTQQKGYLHGLPT